MLEIVIPTTEAFDDETQKFVIYPELTLQFEHSLASLSKWEQIWEKPFLGKDEKTPEQTVSYIKCMCLSSNNLSDEVLGRLSESDINRIREYINSKATATWFREDPTRPPSREIITAEIIYYWMISHGIPFECKHWHLNTLLALIKTCNAKNAPQKKMSPRSIRAQNRALNMQRRAQSGSSG